MGISLFKINGITDYDWHHFKFQGISGNDWHHHSQIASGNMVDNSNGLWICGSPIQFMQGGAP
jgi:hypothetical protein